MTLCTSFRDSDDLQAYFYISLFLLLILLVNPLIVIDEYIRISLVLFVILVGVVVLITTRYFRWKEVVRLSALQATLVITEREAFSTPPVGICKLCDEPLSVPYKPLVQIILCDHLFHQSCFEEFMEQENADKDIESYVMLTPKNAKYKCPECSSEFTEIYTVNKSALHV